MAQSIQLFADLMAAAFILLILSMIWRFSYGVTKLELKYMSGMVMGFSIAVFSSWNIDLNNPEKFYFSLLLTGFLLATFCFFKWFRCTRVLSNSDL